MFENIRMALESLRSNKMRAVLTMLGIIIGIGAVIGIMAMGSAMTNMVDEQMGKFGAYNIYINIQQRAESFTADGGMTYYSPEDIDSIKFSQIQRMADEFKEDIAAYELSEGLTGSYQIKNGRAYANVTVQGANPGYATVEDLKIKTGRFISDNEMIAQRRVCVMSDKAATAIFGKKNPIGESVRVYGDEGVLEFTVIGTYEYEPSPYSMSNTSEKDLNTNLFIPISTLKNNWTAKRNYDYISVKLRGDADLQNATDKFNQFWEKEYRSNKEWRVNAQNMQSMVDESLSMMSTMSIVISVIGAISLLVGGIGVMNIMLVSVTERTHEIGIRKALGAKDGQIMLQFVTEAMILSMVGGIIGIILGQLLGIVGANLVAAMANMDSVSGGVSPLFIAGTVLFSMGIGVFFGLYPAYKASKLDPIDALRYE